MMLIDYEYAGWNPMAYDIANFFNECAVDLVHSGGTGIKYYYQNFPERAEREVIARHYMEHYFHKYANKDKDNSFEDFWAA